MSRCPGGPGPGLAEFDRALGGGLVPGSATLIGGDPGIGKSTLLLQVAATLARGGRDVVYVSGEEAADQVRLRARRLGLGDAPVQLASATSVRDILTTLGKGPAPALLIIDSIQTMHSRPDRRRARHGEPGPRLGAGTDPLRQAGRHGAGAGRPCHQGRQPSPGRACLSIWSTRCSRFEGERSHQYRILRAIKNRFGGTDEIGVFAMAEEGLTEVANPSALFLTQRDERVAGARVFPALEGTRPVLVEIQALTVRLASGATPRRAVVGWDSGRLAMILAVLEARCGLSFSACEVYLNVAGGYRLVRSGGGPGGGGGADLGAVRATGAARCRDAGRDRRFRAKSGPVAHLPMRLREVGEAGFPGRPGDPSRRAISASA